MPDSVCFVALSLLPVWRWCRVADALREGQSPSAILHEHCAEGRRRKAPPPWATPDTVLAQASAALERAAAASISPVTLASSDYPPLLAQIADPPPVLWVSGQMAALAGPAVAIVGSRAGTSYALTVADQLASDLAAAGVCVVSGLARGVDSAAHRGALSARGPTAGVLGCGVDIAYPPENAALIAEVRAAGAVVSELAPGTQPRPGFFPQRNRIISGLVGAVVIVEAGEKSGSLITARCALEQGRDVLAVPGNVLTGRNKGGHALLRDGARVVESAQDIIDELDLTVRHTSKGQLSVPDDPIIRALADGESHDLDHISAQSCLPIHALLPRLLELELQGVVAREAGGRFVRRQRNVLG